MKSCYEYNQVIVCIEGEFFAEGITGWWLLGMSASKPMEIIFNGLYFFVQNNP
jgi:hypothetical protein